MTNGALQGLLYCGNILIPSLFPFMVLSSFAVKSGLSDIIGNILAHITKKIFHIEGCAGAIILIGLVGGFPVGAKGVTTLYDEKRLKLESAQAVTMFLVGGGPGFIVAVIGNALYRDIFTGLILWGCQLVTQFFLGIFSCRKLIYKPSVSDDISYKKNEKALSTSIIEATESGMRGIISLCGLVIIFSCMYGLLEGLKFNDTFENILKLICLPEGIRKSIFPVIWEVTRGCNTCCLNAAPIWLISFALGWGGICVHFQIYALAEKLHISKLKFTLYRFAQGIISAVLTYICFLFYNPAQNVYTSFSVPSMHPGTGSFTGSIALIALCIVFTASVSQSDKSQRMR